VAERRALGADDLLGRYLSEIGRHPLLSREDESRLAQVIEAAVEAGSRLEDSEGLDPEERAHLEAAVDAGSEATATFVRANLRLVVSVAKRYQSSGVPLLDLIQEGNLGLIHAIEKFEWRKGFKLSTYATWWIRQAISRAIADQARTVRVPVHVHGQISKFMKTSRALVGRLGREPTRREVSGALGLPEEHGDLVSQHLKRSLSLEAPVAGDGEATVGQFIVDETRPSATELAIGNQMADQVRKLLHDLSPREAKVLRMRFGIEERSEHTLEQVGNLYGLTRERIRQIEEKALRKLRHPGRSHALRSMISNDS